MNLFLARFLLILTLAFGIGLDFAVAADDVADLRVAAVADAVASADTGDSASEHEWELRMDGAPYRCPPPLERAAHPAKLTLLPAPDLPPRLRPPIGPRLA